MVELKGKVFRVGKEWSTPASLYAEQCLGNARIKRVLYSKGRYYHMRGSSLGFDYAYTESRVPVTTLQIRHGSRWKTWMVDDFLHWTESVEMAKRFRGPRLLIGGLGLGLIVHALGYRKVETEFTEIVVVEREPDVIKLIRPHIPAWPQMRIEQADFYDFIGERHPWDTIFVDLWVGDCKRLMPDFQAKREWIELMYPYPKTLTLYFGFQGWVDMIRDAYAQAAAVRPLLERLQGEQR